MGTSSKIWRPRRPTQRHSERWHLRAPANNTGTARHGPVPTKKLRNAQPKATQTHSRLSSRDFQIDALQVPQTAGPISAQGRSGETDRNERGPPWQRESNDRALNNRQHPGCDKHHNDAHPSQVARQRIGGHQQRFDRQCLPSEFPLRGCRSEDVRRQTSVSRLPGHPVFFAPAERLRQSFQDQVGRLDDALITWTQIRFERLTRQVLQTNDIANGNFITLLR